jgi:hypothetical protein
MPKPTTVLHWADNPTTLRSEPAEGTKNTGFAVNAKLPAQFFNWISGICGDWITWLDNRIFDEYTQPSWGNEVRLYGATDVGCKVRNDANDAYMPLLCLDPDGTDDQQAVTIGWHDKNTCVAARTTTDAMVNGDYITWNWAIHDPSSILDSVGEQKFTLPESGGLWMVSITTAWASISTVIGLQLIKNSSTTVDGMYGVVCKDGSVNSGTITISGIIGGDGDPISAGDYYRLILSAPPATGATLSSARASFTRSA